MATRPWWGEYMQPFERRKLRDVVSRLKKAQAEFNTPESRKTLGPEATDSLRLAYTNIISELEYVIPLFESGPFTDGDEVIISMMIENWTQKVAILDKRKAMYEEVTRTLYMAMIDELKNFLNGRKALQ